jgi:hypothetical protein
MRYTWELKQILPAPPSHLQSVLRIQWYFGVDPDPDPDLDPAIFVIDLQDANKN